MRRNINGQEEPISKEEAEKLDSERDMVRQWDDSHLLMVWNTHRQELRLASYYVLLSELNRRSLLPKPEVVTPTPPPISRPSGVKRIPPFPFTDKRAQDRYDRAQEMKKKKVEWKLITKNDTWVVNVRGSKGELYEETLWFHPDGRIYGKDTCDDWHRNASDGRVTCKHIFYVLLQSDLIGRLSDPQQRISEE